MNYLILNSPPVHKCRKLQCCGGSIYPSIQVFWVNRSRFQHYRQRHFCPHRTVETRLEQERPDPEAAANVHEAPECQKLGGNII